MGIVKCKHCRFAEPLEGVGDLVCKVREGVGGFYVPEDGFCFLAEARRDTCGKCVFFRRYEHKNTYGVYLCGVCCAYKRYAGGADDDREACEKFKPLEDQETREGEQSVKY